MGAPDSTNGHGHVVGPPSTRNSFGFLHTRDLFLLQAGPKVVGSACRREQGWNGWWRWCTEWSAVLGEGEERANTKLESGDAK